MVGRDAAGFKHLSGHRIVKHGTKMALVKSVMLYSYSLGSITLQGWSQWQTKLRFKGEPTSVGLICT